MSTQKSVGFVLHSISEQVSDADSNNEGDFLSSYSKYMICNKKLEIGHKFKYTASDSSQCDGDLIPVIYKVDSIVESTSSKRTIDVNEDNMDVNRMLHEILTKAQPFSITTASNKTRYSFLYQSKVHENDCSFFCCDVPYNQTPSSFSITTNDLFSLSDAKNTISSMSQSETQTCDYVKLVNKSLAQDICQQLAEIAVPDTSKTMIEELIEKTDKVLSGKQVTTAANSGAINWIFNWLFEMAIYGESLDGEQYTSFNHMQFVSKYNAYANQEKQTNNSRNMFDIFKNHKFHPSCDIFLSFLKSIPSAISTNMPYLHMLIKNLEEFSQISSVYSTASKSYLGFTVLSNLISVNSKGEQYFCSYIKKWLADKMLFHWFPTLCFYFHDLKIFHDEISTSDIKRTKPTQVTFGINPENNGSVVSEMVKISKLFAVSNCGLTCAQKPQNFISGHDIKLNELEFVYNISPFVNKHVNNIKSKYTNLFSQANTKSNDEDDYKNIFSKYKEIVCNYGQVWSTLKKKTLHYNSKATVVTKIDQVDSVIPFSDIETKTLIFISDLICSIIRGTYHDYCETDSTTKMDVSIETNVQKQNSTEKDAHESTNKRKRKLSAGEIFETIDAENENKNNGTSTDEEISRPLKVSKTTNKSPSSSSTTKIKKSKKEKGQ